MHPHPCPLPKGEGKKKSSIWVQLRPISLTPYGSPHRRVMNRGAAAQDHQREEEADPAAAQAHG